MSDLKAAYISSKGDMQKILDCIMCATIDDEERFRDILTPLIESKELPSFKKFTNESAGSKKKRQAKVGIHLGKKYFTTCFEHTCSRCQSTAVIQYFVGYCQMPHTDGIVWMHGNDINYLGWSLYVLALLYLQTMVGRTAYV